MNKEKILITGGTGYIGSHTAVEFMEAGFDVVIIDDLSNSHIEVLDGIEKIVGRRPKFEQVDMGDLSALKNFFEAEGDISGVVHFAASKAVGESVEKPTLYYRNNLVSLLNLLDCMREAGTETVVFSSSCTVYGQPASLPVTEETPMKPADSPYGNTKKICEDILRDTLQSGAKLKAAALRYFNPVGAHPSAEIGEIPKGVPNNLVPYITQTAAGLREKLMVFGNDYDTRDGTCIRDFIHVVDLARAHVAAFRKLANADQGAYEVYNLGTGNGNTVMELINAFVEATGINVPYEFAPRRTGDIEKIYADSSLANNALGWKAELGTKDMMASAWKWETKYRGLEEKGAKS